MDDLLVVAIVLLAFYVLIKMSGSSKKPDTVGSSKTTSTVGSCSGDKCQRPKPTQVKPTYVPSEDNLPNTLKARQEMEDVDSLDILTAAHASHTLDNSTIANTVDNIDDSQEDGAAMLEVFTNPKEFQDFRVTLKNIADDPDLTLNYQAKYSKG